MCGIAGAFPQPGPFPSNHNEGLGGRSSSIQAVPTAHCNPRSGSVCRHIPRICRGGVKNEGARRLEQNRPDGQMTQRLRPSGCPVVCAPSKQTMQTENQRQRAGNQQAIIEMACEKFSAHQGFQNEAVQEIQRAGAEKYGVPGISEWIWRIPFHSKARMTNPAPRASSSFRKIVIVKPCGMARMESNGKRRLRGPTVPFSPFF